MNFADTFKLLTGNPPFPWQEALYVRFITGDIPASCNLPTGLGKTSVIAIWLIALANHPDKMPRRLVYVVNRRTVVDQTTVEVEKYQKNLVAAGIATPLAISTLRGQFADNRQWSEDPSRPAVICGTVDMIGSRLLFSGYGLGFKSRPLHAGFLGQDALLVHDEAHLEPAFQELLIAIEKEQRRCKEFGSFRVMELTATSRGDGKAFELTDAEKAIPAQLPEPREIPLHYVWQRLRSPKGMKLHSSKRDAVASTIGELARNRWRSSSKAILIFVRTIDDVKTVHEELTKKLRDGPEELRPGIPATNVQILTGTIRGLERDQLATHDPVFARFMPEPKVPGCEGTAYLICTSAGEVGVDISADHMVCDLNTLDSMAQRLGRVNRRGEGQSEIDVVVESDRNPKPTSPAFEEARWHSKSLLERLVKCDWIEDRREASPASLGVLMRSLTEAERKAAFAPSPTILPVTDILFDAWALTTIRGKLPGRPKVEPYLHGLSDWQPPETYIAWREEVSKLAELELAPKKLGELLEEYPLKPHELLREPSYRAFKHLEAIAKRHPDAPAWLVDDEGNVEVFTLKDVADKDEKDRIEGRTLLLPPFAGGLKSGMLDGSSPLANDVADELFTDKTQTQRARLRVSNKKDALVKDMRLILTIDTKPDADDADEDPADRYWYWFEVANEGGRSSKHPVEWHVHVQDVEKQTECILAKLTLDDKLKQAVQVAAQFHDHGKRRKKFQLVLGNRDYPNVKLAKSGKYSSRVPEKYRHEFGSLIDILKEPDFLALDDHHKEVVLHLIAVHHGRGRPHFPEDEVFDPENTAQAAADIACEVPRRYARLQRKYGRWGLAYLESLLRAADWSASANPSAYLKEDQS